MSDIGQVVKVRVLGKDYEVRPTFAMLVATEKRCGPLMGILRTLGDGLTARNASAIVYEALAAADRKGAPSFDAVLAWASSGFDELKAAHNAASEILSAALPQPKEPEEGADSPPPAE